MAAGLAAAIVAALLLGGCGGDEKREDVDAYIRDVNAIEQELLISLSHASAAYRDFTTDEKELVKLRPKLVAAERSMRRLDRRLGALQPPPEARRLHQLVRELTRAHPAWVKLPRKQPPAHPRGWLRSQPVCKQASAAGEWCDEYPFASTNEGGQANNPSLAPAPEAEQIVQRNSLGNFYLRQASCQPFPGGTPFAVIPVTEKFVPTVSICK